MRLCRDQFVTAHYCYQGVHPENKALELRLVADATRFQTRDDLIG